MRPPRVNPIRQPPAIPGLVRGVVEIAAADAAVLARRGRGARVFVQALGKQARAAAVIALRCELAAIAEGVTHDHAHVVAPGLDAQRLQRERTGAQVAATDEHAVRIHLHRAGAFEHAGVVGLRERDEVGVFVEGPLDADAADQQPTRKGIAGQCVLVAHRPAAQCVRLVEFEARQPALPALEGIPGTRRAKRRIAAADGGVEIDWRSSCSPAVAA
jgi:hypothetical protein